MSNENEGIKFPLSKKQKEEFIDKYDKIFFKKPPHNIKDEKLVEMVNSNIEKLKATNANTQSESSPEGTQNEGGENEQGNSGEGNGTESNGNENNESGILSPLEKISADIKSGEFNGVPSGTSRENDEQEAKAQKEREYQFDQYKQLYGEDADGNLSTDEVAAANVSKLNYNTAMKVYFDLFGKKPIPEMTTDQILNSIVIEQKRQEEAKAKAAAKESTPEDDLKHDPATEMIIVNKKDKNDKRVINKGTFSFLKDSYDAVILEPKELQNFKK